MAIRLDADGRFNPVHVEHEKWPPARTITVNDDLRTATGPIEDATVTVSVETFDDESCRLTVSARNAIGLSDGDAAKLHRADQSDGGGSANPAGGNVDPPR